MTPKKYQIENSAIRKTQKTYCNFWFVFFFALFFSYPFHVIYSQGTIITSTNQAKSIGEGGYLFYCNTDVNDIITNLAPGNKQFFGTGITDANPTDGTAIFSPSTAGVGTYTISYNTKTYYFVVTSPGAATLAVFAPNTYCTYNPAFALTGGAPAGGTYWVSKDGAPAVAQVNFTPSSGAGTYTIQYSVGSGTCISYSAPRTITVYAPPTVTFAPLPAVCEGSASFALTGGAPVGGTYSGTGVAGGIFDPDVSGVGTFPITYSITTNGCTGSATQNQVVNSLPAVSFSGFTKVPPLGYCDSDPSIALTASVSPAGGSGSFSGSGVSNTGAGLGSFNPANSGLGLHDVVYTYITAAGCLNADTQTVRVGTMLYLNGLSSAYCTNTTDIPFTYTPFNNPNLAGNGVSGLGVTDLGGGAGTFNPSVAGTGTHNVKYIFTDDIGCVNTVNYPLVVTLNPVVDFTGFNATLQYCQNASNITLTGNYAPSGNFIGPPGSYTDNGNGTATVYPSMLLVGGPYAFTYSYTNAAGCTDFETKQINILKAPNDYTLTGTGSYCQSTGGLPLTLAGSEDASVSYQLVKGGLNDGAAVIGTGSALVWNNKTAGTYNVVASNANCSSTMSGTVTLTGMPSPLLTNVTGSGTYCEGGIGMPVGLSSSSMGTNYQLRLNGFNEGGLVAGTGSTIDFGNKTTEGVYTVMATLGTCQLLMSGSATIVKKALPIKYSVTGGGSFCDGAAGVAVGLSDSEADVDYELFLNGSSTGQIIAGTGNPLSFGSKTTAGSYTVVARTQTTLCTNNMNGSAVVVKNLYPSDAQLILGTSSLCAGTTQNYSIAAIDYASSYVWSLPPNASITSGVGTNAITVLYSSSATSGNLIVYGTNSCGNGGQSALPVTVNAVPATPAIINGDNKVCQNEENIIYSINSIAGVTNYTWTVPSGSTIVSGQGTTQIIVDYSSVASSGNVTVRAENACGNSASQVLTVTVVAIPQLTLNAPSGDITCSNPSVTITASSSTPLVNYSWNAINGGNITSGANTATATVNASGEYIITVTEPLNSCINRDTATVNYDYLSPQNINIKATNSGIITCQDPQLSLMASTTSTFPVGYSWTASAGGNILSGDNLATPIVDRGGVYTVNVICLSTGCYTTKSITISEQKSLPDISVVDPEPEKITCSSATVALSGSSTTSGVTYSWSGPGILSGANSASPVVNAEGTYTLTLIGPNGCQSVATVQVTTDYTLPNVVVNTNPDNITCAASTISLSGSSSTSGATLQWTGLGIISGATTQTPVVSQANTYTLTVTHPTTGCTDSKTVTVVENKTSPTVNFPVLPSSITCTNPTTTIESSTSAINKTYLWGTLDGTIVSGGSSSTVLVSEAGNYTLTITDTDNGCSNSSSIAVSQDLTTPDAQIAAPGTITCSQSSIALNGSSVTSPINVLWATSNGIIFSGNTSLTPTVTKGGTYTMTISNTSNGCTASANVLVSENKTAPSISISKTNEILTCQKTRVQLSGSAVGANLLWTGPTGSTITNATSTTPTINKAGRYYLTATGANGCTSTEFTDVSGNYEKPLNVQINTPDTLTCTKQSLQLSGSSTTSSATYQWYALNGGNIISASNASTISIDAPGNYKMLVAHPSSFCKDSATITVSEDVSSPIISFPSVPDTITCAVGSVQLKSSVTPANSILLWTGPGVISTPDLSNPTVNTAGIYTLQATHPSTGCVSTSAITVYENKTAPVVSIAIPDTITCNQPTVLLDATSAISDYTASWTTSNGAFSGATNVLDAVATKGGLYTLSFTNNHNGCTSTINVLVSANTANPDITVYNSPSKITCASLEVELYGNSTTTGAKLLWTGPGNIRGATTQRPKVDAVGDYTLTVTGTNGCKSSALVTVSENKTTPAIPGILTPGTLSCNVKTVDLEVSPLLSNVDYIWTTTGSGLISNSTTSKATVNTIGTYKLTVTDRTSGCSNENLVSVSENKTIPSAIITGTPYILTCSVASLQLNGNSSTGINPVWKATAGGHIVSGANTLLPTIDATGTYILTVYDATTGCPASASVVVDKSADVPGINIDAFPDTLTCSVTSVTLFGEPTESGTSYTWTESPGNIVSGRFTNSPVVNLAGNYILTVTNNTTLCARTAAIEVKQDTSAPQLSIGNPEKFTCTRTQVQLNASSPETNVAYFWTTSGTGSIKPGDEVVKNPIVYTPEKYRVTVTNLENQCSSNLDVIVGENKTLPDINVDKTPAQLTCAVKQVTLSGTSLTSGVVYLWTGPGNISNPTSASPSVDTTGTYTLQVTDPGNGCSVAENVTVTSNTAVPNIWVDTNPGVLNCVNSTIQIKGNSSTSNVTYNWNGPGNISDPSLKEPFVDAPGTYQLTATSALNGCSSVLPVTVTKNITVPAAPLASGNYSCYGSTATSLTATGNNIQWYSSPAIGLTNKIKSGSTLTPGSIIAVGDYYFYATQTDAVSLCESPAIQVTYSVKALPAAPTTINNEVCQGLPNTTLQASGTNIKWYDAPAGNLLITGATYTPPSSVNTAGSHTYFATQTDAFGCQSTEKDAVLTIHPIPAKPLIDKLTDSVCYGNANPAFNASGINLKWYANTSLNSPLETGSLFQPLESNVGLYNFYVNQTSSYGCVSPYETITLIILSIPQQFTVTGGGVYCEGQSGLSVGLSGSEMNTVYELILNGGTIITSVNGTGSALDFGLQKAAGNYTVLATNNNTCNSYMSGGVSIITNPLPGASGTITGTTAVCEGATSISYSLAPVSNASSYVWSIPSGATISSGLNSNAITVDFKAGSITGNINVYAQNSCGVGSISPNLQVLVSTLPDAATYIKYIGSNNSICLGDTGIVYEVDAIANASSYEWVLPAGASIVYGQNTRQIKVNFAFNSTTGTQEVRVRGKNSCGYGSYSADYAVDIFANPGVFAGIDQNICSNSTSLQGSSIPSEGTGTWELIDGAATITNNTSSISTLNSLAQGENIFTWTISQNGCVSVDTVKVINNQLLVDAGENNNICNNGLTLGGSAVPAGAAGLWSVVSGQAAFSNASSPSAFATNFYFGENKLYWTVSKNGCNSIDSVLITSYKPSNPDAGADQIICSNQTWLAAKRPQFGMGQWYLFSGAVTITDPLLQNTQITNVSPGKNVLLWKVTNQFCSVSDTVVIWNNTNPVNAGYNQVLCENRTTLDATVPPTGAITQWSVLQGSATFIDSKLYNSKISGLSNGVNKLIWSVTKGSCTNTDTVELTSNMPTMAKAGGDQQIPGSTTTLEGNRPLIGKGKWTLISGAAFFTNDTLYNTTVSGLNSGPNILAWTIENKGCTTTDMVQITNGTLESVDAGENQVICLSETQLEAMRPIIGFGKWTVQKGSARFENNELYNSKVFDLLPGNNVLRWTVTLGSIEFFDTVVITNNKPTIAMVGPKQSICGDSSVLTGNLAIDGTGRWTLEGGSATIANPAQYNSKISNLGYGDNTFRWTITKGDCKTSVLLTVANNNPTVAYAGTDQVICEDSTSLLPTAPSIGIGEWSVAEGAGIFLGNKVMGLAQGNNILRWTIRKNNCISFDDVKITSNKPTKARAGSDAVVCIDSVYLAGNKANTALGEISFWSVMSGSGTLVSPSLNTSLIRGLGDGTNILRWTIKNNECISYSDVKINYAFIKSDAGADVTTCDDYVSLNANNPGIGQGEWTILGSSGSALFTDSKSANTEVKNLDKGKNILRWTIRNLTCVSTDHVTITNNAPSISYAGGDQSICTNSAILSASKPQIGKGSWSVLSGSGTFADTSSVSTSVNNVGSGINTFRWTVTNNNCISTDEVVIANNNPIGTFAGPDQTLCYDSTVLNANVPAVGTGVWSIVKGSGSIADIYNSSTIIKNLAPNINILRWSVTNKYCTEYDEFTIVNNTPTIANAGVDRVICSDNVTLDGNIPVQGAGEWTLISGAGNFTDKNSYNSLVQGLSLGNNIFRWTMAKENCFLYDDVVITNDLPTAPEAGTTIIVCDSVANLNGNKPIVGYGFWSVSSGYAKFADNSMHNTLVSRLGQGANMLLWTIKHNNCSLSDMVEVRNNQTNVYAGPDTTILKDQIKLAGNEPPRGQGSWKLIAGSGNITTPDNYETEVTGLYEGVNTFMWSVNIEGCISSDEVKVTYFKMPSASFSVSSSDGCVPLSVTFTKTTFESYPFIWQFGENDSTSEEEKVTYIYTKPGIYTASLHILVPGGITVSKEQIIQVNELPEVKFDIVPKNIYIPNESLRCYNYSLGGSKYKWSFGDGSYSEEFNPSHTYTDSGFYTIGLTVWTEEGCPDSLILVNGIQVIETSKFHFPTAFTPNPSGSSGGRYNTNDYSNDVFYPIVVMGDIEKYKLQVYNRWGMSIFESNDINIGWDGYYKGKLVAEGIYIYRVTGIYNSGEAFSVTGDFLLIKR